MNENNFIKPKLQRQNAFCGEEGDAFVCLYVYIRHVH